MQLIPRPLHVNSPNNIRLCMHAHTLIIIKFLGNRPCHAKSLLIGVFVYMYVCTVWMHDMFACMTAEKFNIQIFLINSVMVPVLL